MAALTSATQNPAMASHTFDLAGKRPGDCLTRKATSSGTEDSYAFTTPPHAPTGRYALRFVCDGTWEWHGHAGASTTDLVPVAANTAFDYVCAPGTDTVYIKPTSTGFMHVMVIANPWGRG